MQEGCGTVKRWPPEGCILEDVMVVGHHPVPCLIPSATQPPLCHCLGNVPSPCLSLPRTALSFSSQPALTLLSEQLLRLRYEDSTAKSSHMAGDLFSSCFFPLCIPSLPSPMGWPLVGWGSQLPSAQRAVTSGV